MRFIYRSILGVCLFIAQSTSVLAHDPRVLNACKSFSATAHHILVDNEHRITVHYGCKVKFDREEGRYAAEYQVKVENESDDVIGIRINDDRDPDVAVYRRFSAPIFIPAKESIGHSVETDYSFIDIYGAVLFTVYLDGKEVRQFRVPAFANVTRVRNSKI